MYSAAAFAHRLSRIEFADMLVLLIDVEWVVEAHDLDVLWLRSSVLERCGGGLWRLSPLLQLHNPSLILYGKGYRCSNV